MTRTTRPNEVAHSLGDRPRSATCAALSSAARSIRREAPSFDLFDVLAVNGLPVTMKPYSERRALLEELDLENHHVRLVATFEDGEALFNAVCERGPSRALSRSGCGIRIGRASGSGEDEESGDGSVRRGARPSTEARVAAARLKDVLSEGMS